MFSNASIILIIVTAILMFFKLLQKRKMLVSIAFAQVKILKFQKFRATPKNRSKI